MTYVELKCSFRENFVAHKHLRSQLSRQRSLLLPATAHTMVQLRTLLLISVMLSGLLSSAAKDEFMEARKPKVKNKAKIPCFVAADEAGHLPKEMLRVSQM